MSRASKKAKFTQNNSKKSSAIFLIGVALLALVGISAFLVLREPAGIEGTVNVGEQYNTTQPVAMTKVDAEISDTKVVVNVEDIKQNKLVAFNVPGISFSLANGTPFDYLPMTAYVSPKGNLVLARSLCEPCSGTDFHIEGENLVCNSCGTMWSLEELKGVYGGCTEYPPETVEYEVDGNNMTIDMDVLKNWQPRSI